MKSFHLISLLLLLSAPSLSQNTREVAIGPGKNPSAHSPVKDRYRFPEFQSGYLITHDNKRSQPLKLNFNLFSELPQFIDQKGDTLFLDEHLAKVVFIGDLVYVHPEIKEYYELVTNTEPVKLAISRKWRLSKVATIAPAPMSNQPTETANRNVGNMVYSVEQRRMIRNETSFYRRDSSYLFINAKGRQYKVNESNLSRLFPELKKEIEEMVEKEKIDFDNEADLKKVLEFCIAGLPK